MDSFNFDFLNNDDDIIDDLVGIASLPDEPMNNYVNNNMSANIVDYILFNQDNRTTHNNQENKTIHSENTSNNNFVQDTVSIECSSNDKQLPFSVLEEKDNFVTFTPLFSTQPKQQVKTGRPTKKSRGPIFVTASPQTFSKKFRKYPGNPQSSYSSDEHSDDDDGPSQMSSKEKRLHRNKMSARKFRVRRKEYIKQLQEQVKEQAETIQKLEQQVKELQKTNEELMQYRVPSTSSVQEICMSSNRETSSSGSEDNHSPEPALSTAFQNQLTTFYDVNLFNNLQFSQAQPQFDIHATDLFYFNHAVIPDWDLSRILSEKGQVIASEEEQRQVSRDLLNTYPLLAPALMSIILRHTLSIEYVAGLTEDLKKEIFKNKSDQDIEQMKSHMNRLQIEPKNTEEPKDEESENELETILCILNDYYSHYAVHRAMGKSHKEAYERHKECMIHEKEKELAKQKKKETKGSLPQLQVYSRVAGDLLRYPQRLTRIRHILKSRPEFKKPVRNDAIDHTLPASTSSNELCT